MFCVSCGNQLPDDAVFCNRCGTKNVQPSSPNLPLMQYPKHVTIELSETMRTNMNPGTQPVIPLSGPMSQPGPVDMQQASNGQYPTSWSGPMIPEPPTLSVYPVSQPILQNITVSNPMYPMYPGYPESASPTPPPVSLTPLLPLTAFQRFLVRVFQPSLASNTWLGVTLGGVIAFVGSALGTALLLTIAQSLLPGKNDQVFTDLGMLNLQSSFRNSLQLLMIALGAGSHYQSMLNGNIYTFEVSSQLDGLLFIPVLFLIIGGYIAASTDFQNRIRVTLGRGVAVSIPFTLLLLVAVLQVNGVIPGVNGVIQANNATLSIDIPSLLIYGFVWGCLFGLLGATLKLAYGQWRLMISSFIQTSRYSQLLGMSIGAVFATCLGIALSLLLILSVTIYTSFSIPILGNALCIQTGWQDLTLWGLTQGPLHAVNLFAFSYGSPVVVSNPTTNACFYIHVSHTTISILDPLVQHFKWLNLLLILPAISLFCGGRVSVAASKVRGLGAATLQGSLMAIPFTLLMVALCLMSSINYVQTSTATQSYTESAGVDLFMMLVWSLLSGAAMGALGGLYQASALSNGIHRILAALTFPLLLLGKPLIFVLNAITGQSRVSTASTDRLLFYAALISAILLAVACGVVGSTLINMNQIISFEENQHTLNILDVLTFAIPGLFLLLAGAVALTSDPSAHIQRVPLRSAPSNTFPYGNQERI